MNNDNAFPSLELTWNQDSQRAQYELSGGLTKRELFAAMAMQGLRAYSDQMASEYYAKRAVADADALLAELAK